MLLKTGRVSSKYVLMTAFLVRLCFPHSKERGEAKCRQSDVTIQASDWLLRMPFDCKFCLCCFLHCCHILELLNMASVKERCCAAIIGAAVADAAGNFPVCYTFLADIVKPVSKSTQYLKY